MANKKYLKALPIVFIFLCSFSHGEDEEDLMALYGGEEFISIATGVEQPLHKAPAVVSVLTKKDIERIGATDIDEILETVPGLHVARDAKGYNPIYVFRGINATENPQVLMLINGIPITNLFQGDRNLVWGGMPVQAISRVEVIRGPGSALYGADAFAGVINVVTHEADGVSQFKTGVRYGTHNTKDYWLSGGGSVGELKYYGVVESHETDGFDEKVKSDQQSNFDSLLGTSASLAPGSVNMERDNIDARMELAYKKFRLRAGAQIRDGAGDYAGAAQALSADNKFSSDRLNVDLTYENEEFIDDLAIKVQTSYLHTTQEVEGDLVLYPEGTVVPPIGGFGVYTDGVIGTPELKERHTRFNFSSLYSGINRHKIAFGTGYYHGELYEVEESKNFGLDPSTGLPIPPGDPAVDVTDLDDYVFISEGGRENTYVFIQDVWQLFNDWELTAGVRYDHYSDFGDTVNPRLALVWSTSRNLTTKFIYGEAFRAPSFAQTRVINNPLVEGNPELDPEEMKSYEIAFDYRPRHDLTFNLNAFYYKWEDIIQFVPVGGGASEAQNNGEQTGHGVEFETTWQAFRDLELSSNFSWQKSEDRNLDADAAHSPEKQLYMAANWQPTELWNIHVQANWVMDRNRAAGADDFRSDIDNYALVDLTIRRKSLWDHVDIALLVKNLFDEGAREPSLAGGVGFPVPIEDDLPLAGQTISGEIRYNF
ncbi:MAG: TonB-dependent receptor [Porticoccus sp.]|nr:TonB-dependent receptor [Porticoccus sp.]MBQ0806780.1 TonB-dependent receptor [Porticoccus sp.]